MTVLTLVRGSVLPAFPPFLEKALAEPRRLHKRERLHRIGDPAHALFALASGSLKSTVVAEDGRDQVADFHLPGDILGLETLGQERYASEISALEESVVGVVPFSRLAEMTRDDPAARQEIVRLMSRELQRRQELLLVLGGMRAEQRLASFLLDLSCRLDRQGLAATEIVLRMTREEIASHLGLQLETVSRLFTRMQQSGLVQVQGRSVRLIDTPALKALVRRDP